MNTDTPKTDAATLNKTAMSGYAYSYEHLVFADFARELERENARLREALELIYGKDAGFMAAANLFDAQQMALNALARESASAFIGPAQK